MAEEQLFVLKLLEEGKVSVEEASQLLQALQAREAAPVTIGDNVGDALGPVAQDQSRRLVRAEAAKHRQDDSERSDDKDAEAKRSGASSGADFPLFTALRALGLASCGGPEFTSTRRLSGIFTADQASVHIRNTNGALEVEKSSDDQWHLELRIKVRAENAEDAEALIKDLIDIVSDEEQLTLEVKRVFGRNLSVRIALLLPEAEFSELSFSSTNGSIAVKNLRARRLLLQTVNGRVSADDLHVHDLQASSVNGRLNIEGAFGHLHGRAANGRIIVNLTEALDSELDLKSVNGSVRVNLPEQEDISYVLDLGTTSGSIRHGLPGVVTQSEVRRAAKSSLLAASPEDKQKKAKQTVTARTVSGSIRINAG